MKRSGVLFKLLFIEACNVIVWGGHLSSVTLIEMGSKTKQLLQFLRDFSIEPYNTTCSHPILSMQWPQLQLDRDLFWPVSVQLACIPFQRTRCIHFKKAYILYSKLKIASWEAFNWMSMFNKKICSIRITIIFTQHTLRQKPVFTIYI